MPYENVLIDRRDDGVAVLTLNRPDAMNSLNGDLMRELPHAARELAEDEDVRCIVLTGAGDVFCAGGDTRAIGKMADDQVKSAAPPKSSFEKRTAWLAKCSQASRILHQAPKPVIAMINGACAGAGLNLAGACDIRYAGASARFRSAFIAMGLSSDYGGNWLWTQILGTGKARQLFFIDKKRNAEEALEFGLIDQICADDALEAETMELASKLASMPAKGMYYAKTNLNAVLHQTLEQAIEFESRNLMLCRAAITEMRKRQEAK
ncbi:MAG: enoyl-CoA hydratase/isomerase family protein [Novosphingobium sp.]|nr:enoyl-CoA hydratase/isomerase family protein [Novosphingobium sp.]